MYAYVQQKKKKKKQEEMALFLASIQALLLLDFKFYWETTDLKRFSGWQLIFAPLSLPHNLKKYKVNKMFLEISNGKPSLTLSVPSLFLLFLLSLSLFLTLSLSLFRLSPLTPLWPTLGHLSKFYLILEVLDLSVMVDEGGD